ncbi:LysR substrate-binding domain-containing protein [Microbacterium sp. KUDC0406]|uniref:LysR family transcriptional regulator n=1 Tax=Microbacterium sp. KUDC0406 TaxID=2909588 RepID=UPI001F2BBD54|nr:LysR substrate-binding domain-containing protein [Microbacterium sp. KUDC0406]UJP09329.1 LysR substrate-binding domain-containing protein [Microbacterium sp. KUDC0406]
MRLEELRSFEAVARLGHFTRAADELFLTQPSLSRQIQALESDLGTILFQRDRTGVAITTAGEALLPIARRMLADAEAARHEMDELAGLRRGRIRLGAPPTLCVSVVAEVVAVFRRAHPGIDLHITEAGSRALVDALSEGALDLALTITRPSVRDDPSVELVPLFTEELVVVSAADTALAPPEGVPSRLTITELARLPQVAFNRSYDLRVATDVAFEAAGLTPVIAVEGAEMDAVLRFVARGIGVAVVPATVLLGRPELRGSQLHDPSLTRTANLSRRTTVRSSVAVAAIESTIFDVVAGLAHESSGLGGRITPVG